MKTEGISGLLSPFVKKFRIEIALKFIKEGMEVLDIGPGFGEIIKSLPSEVKYTGIERDEYLFKYLKEKYPQRKFISGDAELILEEIEGKFDVVLLLSVIEHLKNPEELINRLKEKLKEEGKILIYTPSRKAKGILYLGSKLGLLSKIAEGEHQKLFNKNDLIEKIEGLGFNLIFQKDFFLSLSLFLVFEKKS
ncbi:MAG: class I SAM-dependent methyltransferase [Thermoanaerobaculia bacterium]